MSCLYLPCVRFRLRDRFGPPPAPRGASFRATLILVAAFAACLVRGGTGRAEDATSAVAEAVRNAPWTVYRVGVGVVLKTHRFADLFGGGQDVFVVEADMDAPGVSLRFIGGRDGSRRPVSRRVEGIPNAVAAVNGAWFNGASGWPDQFLRIDGQHLADTHPVAQERGGIVIEADGRVRCLPRPEDGWASLAAPHVMASEVPSVVAGQPYVWTSAAPGTGDHSYYYVNRAPRSAIGTTGDGRVLLLVVDGRRAPEAVGMSHAQVAELLIALGAVNATQLDGGGSSTVWGRDLGVVNTPSDGRERAVAMAVCVVAPPLERAYMGKWLGDGTAVTLDAGEPGRATMRFLNTGSEVWGSDILLSTTEPRGRESLFRAPDWLDARTPCGLRNPGVGPGEVGEFDLRLLAPDSNDALTFHEAFGLMRADGQRFGAERNRLALTVNPRRGAVPRRDILIESRGGGRNHGWYSERGAWADVGVDCRVPGSTPGIGMRYASTNRSVAGLKSAVYRPVLEAPGIYEVFVAWGAAGNRRAPVTYRVEHADGVHRLQLDQTAEAECWVSLGRYRFEPGSGGSLQVSNEDIDTRGNLYAGAVRFVLAD